MDSLWWNNSNNISWNVSLEACLQQHNMSLSIFWQVYKNYIGRILHSWITLSKNELLSMQDFQNKIHTSNSIDLRILMQNPHHLWGIIMIDTLKKITRFDWSEIEAFFTYLQEQPEIDVFNGLLQNHQTQFQIYWRLYAYLHTTQKIDTVIVNRHIAAYNKSEQSHFLSHIASMYETQGMWLINTSDDIFNTNRNNEERMASLQHKEKTPNQHPDHITIRNEILYIHLLDKNGTSKDAIHMIEKFIQQWIIDTARWNIYKTYILQKQFQKTDILNEYKKKEHTYTQIWTWTTLLQQHKQQRIYEFIERYTRVEEKISSLIAQKIHIWQSKNIWNHKEDYKDMLTNQRWIPASAWLISQVYGMRHGESESDPKKELSNSGEILTDTWREDTYTTILECSMIFLKYHHTIYCWTRWPSKQTAELLCKKLDTWQEVTVHAMPCLWNTDKQIASKHTPHEFSSKEEKLLYQMSNEDLIQFRDFMNMVYSSTYDSWIYLLPTHGSILKFMHMDVYHKYIQPKNLEAIHFDRIWYTQVDATNFFTFTNRENLAEQIQKYIDLIHHLPRYIKWKKYSFQELHDTLREVFDTLLEKYPKETKETFLEIYNMAIEHNETKKLANFIKTFWWAELKEKQQFISRNISDLHDRIQQLIKHILWRE